MSTPSWPWQPPATAGERRDDLLGERDPLWVKVAAHDAPGRADSIIAVFDLFSTKAMVDLDLNHLTLHYSACYSHIVFCLDLQFK